MTKDSGGWRGQRGTRHERGYGYAWTITRARILKRDKHLCQPCLKRGRYVFAYAVDHEVSKAEGGTDEDTNLRAICHDCHAPKTADEAARAQGRRVRPVIGEDGWPVDTDD